MNAELIRKYNVPGPRYTSYPPVPFWGNEPPSPEKWKRAVKETFDQSNDSEGISLYVHLPYCESLCTYCGCTTRITVNHAVEEPYIDTLLKEWGMYLDTFGKRPRIAEIHLGGGTPTFFKPENLVKLIKGIKSNSTLCDDAELGFEAHPNSTSKQHLQALYDQGFRRLSLGIQDFDPKVQKIVNRVQTYETVKKVVENARAIGYTSINFDLIYGLPLQEEQSIKGTIEKVSTLLPDRIAFYSYAHVPWVKPGQRMFTEKDLPDNDTKRALYELGKQLLENLGYYEIGMDHFALQSDDLYHAAMNGKLHRNFMGYTPKHTKLLIGLGASSISDTWTSYGQNVKKIKEYKELVDQNQFPVFKGHQLSDKDLILRKHITNLMCKLHTDWSKPEDYTLSLEESKNKLTELVDDKLISINEKQIEILASGRPFVRNVCMAIDERLWKNNPESQIFSKVI